LAGDWERPVFGNVDAGLTINPGKESGPQAEAIEDEGQKAELPREPHHASDRQIRRNTGQNNSNEYILAQSQVSHLDEV
jgi:hypothetical protein